MFTTEQIDRLLNQGANVLSEDGEKIGSIGQVFVDNADGQPSWVTVRTGLFGMSETFVPLEGARTEGNDIVVPYSKNQVKDAPRIDADRPLEPAEEDRLYQHYQLDTGRTYDEARSETADSAPGADRTGAPVATGGTSGTGYGTAEQQDTTAPERTGASTSDTTTPERTQAPTAAAAAAAATGSETAARIQQRDTTPDRAEAPGAAGTGTGTGNYDIAAQRDTAPGPSQAAAAGYGTTAATAQRDTAAPDRTTGYGTAAPTEQRDTTQDRAQAPAAAGTGTGAYDTTAQRDSTAPDRTAAPTAGGTGPGTTEYDAAAPTEQRDTTPDRAPAPGAAGTGTGAPSATGRARLRKYVTTEQVTKTVPVQREEVRIEREPITEENRDEAMNRPDKDDERDVILHEERLIVTKESVPVERVHIGTETVTDEVTINEEVRKEHIGTGEPEEGRG